MWCCHGRTPGQRVGIKKTTSVTSTIVDGSEIRRSPVDMENIPWFTRVSIMSGGFLAGFLVAINSSNCCMSTNPVNFQLPQVFPLPVSQAPIWMRCPNAPNLLPSWLMQVPQKMAILSMGSSCVTWAKSPLVPVAQLLRPCQVLWRTQEVEKVSNTTKKTMIEIKQKKISVGGIQKQQGGLRNNSCFHKCQKKTLRIAALPAALCQPVPEPWKLRNLSEPIETWNHLRNPANLSEPSKPPTTSCRNPSKPGTVEPGSFPEPPHLRQNTSKSILCKKPIAFCCWGTIVCCSANLNEVTIRLWDCFPVKKKQWKVEVSNG